MFKVELFGVRRGVEYVDIPFVPTPGMYIKTENTVYAMMVSRVIYDVESGVFEVTLEEQK